MLASPFSGNTNKPRSAYSHSSTQEFDGLYEKARQCVEERDFHQACVFFSRCLRIGPDNLSVLIPLALVLYKTNRIKPAMTMYRKALRLSPNHAGVLTGMGNCYLAEGKFAKATAHFRRALEVNPEEVHAMHNLTMLNRYPLDASMVDNLRRLHASSVCTGLPRAVVCFSLGRIYESHGDHHLAFRYYSEGNAAMVPLVMYDESRDIALFEEIRSTFTRQFFRTMRNCGRSDASPIFVLGMPRSGTSLVEQILASHSGVYGAGEASILPWMVNRLIPQTFGEAFPKAILGMNVSEFKELADLYLELLSIQCPIRADRIVSKTLDNYLLIGLIQVLFPNAPIVHCVRDPMDTCWSLFRHYFGIETAPGYAYDQGTLGRQYRRYRRLMDHWHSVLPGRIHDVCYEELVKNPEGAIRALLEYCDLSWEESCLAFYRTQRMVNTASAMQVRRPLYETSIRSWLPVGERLAPLRAALEGH